MGASMSMLVITSLTVRTPYPRSTCRQRLRGLPIAQGSFDGGVQAVQAHVEQSRGAVVAGKQVVLESLHQRADERRVLTGDRGRHPVGHRRQVEPQSQ